MPADVPIEDGHVRVTYNAGFIVLSYVISFIGCMSCLEILHLRTARRGLYNWLVLAAASVSLANIGIWCMHFVGNRAIVLGDGKPGEQIFYDAAFTAISFFVPLAVIMPAFYLIGGNESDSLCRLLIVGLLTGAAVCGMHYLGQLGISNYRCRYYVGNVVGSAIISVAACVSALGIFFRLHATWAASWVKRVASAAGLAMAVSGMHWTAAVGTSYYPRSRARPEPPDARFGPHRTVVVCAVLACSAAAMLIGVVSLASHRRQQAQHRVRQLMVACAFFDPMGRVMVSPDGLLPSHKITSRRVDRMYAEDEFSNTHPAFFWAFRASRSWTFIKPLIPRIRVALRRPPSDFDQAFKLLFCGAAQELADHVSEPFEFIGQIYDDILASGSHFDDKTDPECLTHIFGRGKIMFTVRHLQKQDADSLASRGFRFAEPPRIGVHLANSMHVPAYILVDKLEKMRDYDPEENIMAPGVHMAAFSLFPAARGFEVLTLKDSPSVLPHATLSPEPLTEWQRTVLEQMEGSTVASCRRWLKRAAVSASLDPADRDFFHQLHATVLRLEEILATRAFTENARFSPRPFRVPCYTDPSMTTSNYCTVYIFALLNQSIDVDAPAFAAPLLPSPAPGLLLTPLPLFNAQQQVYPAVPDRDVFCEQISNDFRNLPLVRPGATGMTPPTSPERRRSPSWWMRLYPFIPFGGSILPAPSGRSSPSSSLDGPSTELPLAAKSTDFGGIRVDNRVTVTHRGRTSMSFRPGFGAGDEELDIEGGDGDLETGRIKWPAGIGGGIGFNGWNRKEYSETFVGGMLRVCLSGY